MKIKLSRKTSNNLYTEGMLYVNGARFSYTLEHTFTMLPTGEYKVMLKKFGKSCRKIVITPLCKGIQTAMNSLQPSIAHGNSWKDALTGNAIIVGEPLFAGAVKRSKEAYTHLFDRLEKCKTAVTLCISDRNCKESKPLEHWIK